MLTTLVRRQLIAFAVVSVLSVAVLCGYYLRIPAQLGWGRYQVGVDLGDASGLYDGAPVTFRGVEVGSVRSLALTATGVRAELSLSDGTSIPRSSLVEVLSASAIGEPYLNFRDDRNGAGPALPAGAVVPRSQVRLPISTAELFSSADRFLRTLPARDLHTVVDEAYAGVTTPGVDLGHLLDTSTQLVHGALAAQRPTTDLLDSMQRVLATQDELRFRLSTSMQSLDALSGALVTADPTLRSLLRGAGPTSTLALRVMNQIQPSLRALLIDGGDVLQVASIYVPALRQILIMLPVLIEANKSVQVNEPGGYGESHLSFKMNVNDPPVCTAGFPEAGHQRNPDDLTPKALPANSYCKLSHENPQVSRGARNLPCPNDPSRRGATAALCGLYFNKHAYQH